MCGPRTARWPAPCWPASRTSSSPCGPSAASPSWGSTTTPGTTVSPPADHLLHRLDRVGVGRALVGPVGPPAGEAQRPAARIAARHLHPVEGDLHHQFRAEAHGEPVVADLKLPEPLRL